MSKPHDLHSGNFALRGQHHPLRAMTHADVIRHRLTDAILARHPDLWPGTGLICRTCLNRERTAAILADLERDRGEISKIEKDIGRKASEHIAIAEDIEQQFEQCRTVGQRVADAAAGVGGSWLFIGGFFSFVVAWMGVNSWWLATRPFDPFPFILLNLLLSCLAAIQAPIIMMAQSRLLARDRLRAKLDYRINLKAEIEIASLHQKLDHLLHQQWSRMFAVQETQLDMLAVLGERRKT